MALLNRRLIAARRAALGLSRHELAQASGLPTGTLEHIENRGIHDNLQLDCAVKLAAALGWTLAHTLAALRMLDRRLSGTGQGLQHLPMHRYALVPAMTAVSQSQRCDAAHRQLHRLDVATARVLHRIVCGPRQDRRWNAYTDDDRRHLAQLVNLGFVHDAGGQLEISAELMENLGLRHPSAQTDDATDIRMTESADILLTEPLTSE